MIETPLTDVATVIDAVPHRDGQPVTAAELVGSVGGIVRIDSRDLDPGDLFLAIQGGNVDGHDYLAQAHERGAVAAIVDHLVDDAPPSLAQLVVNDTIEALTALAREHARRLASSTTIIGITGSSGKTTTKDLVAQVLESAGPTIAPPGSFNNEIGLPTTVLRADRTTDYLILEMGARGIGHIAHLVDIAAPRVGAVLNVGSAHAGEFGGRDATAQAKGELIAGLPADGVAILNGDDPLVSAMAALTEARVLRFGEGGANEVRAEAVSMDADGRATFTLVVGDQRAQVSLGLAGRHMVSNALAAAGIAVACGLPVSQVAAELTAARARSPWRMEVVRTARGPVVVNDAYNANPDSVAAALASVSLMHRDARLWVVVGEMLELGDESMAAHRQVGRQAVEAGADAVIAVGQPSVTAAVLEGVADARSRSGGTVQTSRAEDARGAMSALVDVAHGDLVLVKASRGIGLDTVASSLVERFGRVGGDSA